MKLEIDFRALISFYGYSGFIGEKYTYFAIKNNDLDEEILSKIRMMHQKIKENDCKENGIFQMLEHIITDLQNQIYTVKGYPRLKCLHNELNTGKLTRPQHLETIFIRFYHRAIISTLIENLFKFLNGEILNLITNESVEYFNERIEDLILYKFLKELEKRGIPNYDVEDDSRLLALGEGRNCMIIWRKLQNEQLYWLKRPFPELDLDIINEINPSIWQKIEFSSSNSISEIIENYIQKWIEFKDLISKPIIPKHLITGTNGKTTTARMIAHIIRELTHKKIGLTSTSGIYIDGEKPKFGDFTGPWSARNTLLEPIEEAIFEVARGGLIREGVIFNEVKSSTLTNVSADHLGLRGINSVEEMAKIKSIILQAATDVITLNLDNEPTKMILNKIKSERFPLKNGVALMGFSMNPENLSLTDNIVYLDKNEIKLKIHNRPNTIPLVNVKDLPYTYNGSLSYLIINSLSVIATTIGLGYNYSEIISALKKFDQSEGRGTIFSHHDRLFVIDYGHNPAALIEIKNTINNLKKTTNFSKVILLALTAGDRDDDHLGKMGEIYAEMPIDEIILKDLWVDLRGRETGEVGLIVSRAMKKKGFDGIIHQEPDPEKAIILGLKRLPRNGLFFICAEKYGKIKELIVNFNYK